MSLIPDFDGMDDEIEENGDLDEDGNEVYDLPKEYGIDFTTGQLTGKIVEGLEAVKVWIWLALKTPRYRFAIHDWDYGLDLEEYVGQMLTQEFVDTDIKKEVEDCMYVNPWITDVTDWDSTIEGDKLHIKFTAVTDFGEAEVDEFV